MISLLLLSPLLLLTAWLVVTLVDSGIFEHAINVFLLSIRQPNVDEQPPRP